MACSIKNFVCFSVVFSAAVFAASCTKNIDTKSAQINPAQLEPSQDSAGRKMVIQKGMSVEEYLKQQKIDPLESEDEIVTESLWDETYGTGLLFVDHKARRVGDVVTVEIIESSSASKNASTKTSPDSSIEAGVDSLLGLPMNLGMKNFLDSGQPFSPNVKGGFKSGFSGSGSTSRSGKITATISAEVVEVLPNNNLRIFGHREIKVNQENQIITVSGIARPQDIDGSNSLKSTSLAEAQIKYFGTGVIGDKQNQGWLAKFFEFICPF